MKKSTIHSHSKSPPLLPFPSKLRYGPTLGDLDDHNWEDDIDEVGDADIDVDIVEDVDTVGDGLVYISISESASSTQRKGARGRTYDDRGGLAVEGVLWFAIRGVLVVLGTLFAGIRGL